MMAKEDPLTAAELAHQDQILALAARIIKRLQVTAAHGLRSGGTRSQVAHLLIVDIQAEISLPFCAAMLAEAVLQRAEKS